MSKFWTSETKEAFQRHPVRCTAMVTGCAIWYVLFAGLTLIFGGVLVLAGKSDNWVDWWLP